VLAVLLLGLAVVLGHPAGARAHLVPYNGCEPDGHGNFVCNWSANPVFAPDGALVGVLGADPQPAGFSSGANTIQCQTSGRLVFIALDANGESTAQWAWARATDGQWGWTSEAGADWGLGGEGVVFHGFSNVPDCGSAHGPAPGNPGYPVAPPHTPPITEVAQPLRHASGCTARQWRTVHFRFYEQRYVVRKGTRRALADPGAVRFGSVRVGDSTCPSGGAHAESADAQLRVRSAGLRSTAAGPTIAGHGATRGWGIAVTRTTHFGAIRVAAVKCRPGHKRDAGLRALKAWPNATPRSVELGARIRVNRHARLRGCADLGAIDLSLRSDAHGRLRVVPVHGAMVGDGVDSQTAYHHRAGHPGATLYYSRDIVAPQVGRGHR
jgi:hypothetical protein